MKMKTFTDKDGDLWAEHPLGSGMLVCIDQATLGRVADKFGSSAISDVREALGPLTELAKLTPKETNGHTEDH
jgi:hypothetical protein